MKNLLEYKLESLKKPKEEWEILFSRLIYIFSTWNIEEGKLDNFKFKWNEESEFECEFLREFILYALGLDKNVFWRKTIFVVTKRWEENTPYDTHKYTKLQVNVIEEKSLLEEIKAIDFIKDINDYKEYHENYTQVVMKIYDINKLFSQFYVEEE